MAPQAEVTRGHGSMSCSSVCFCLLTHVQKNTRKWPKVKAFINRAKTGENLDYCSNHIGPEHALAKSKGPTFSRQLDDPSRDRETIPKL